MRVKSDTIISDMPTAKTFFGEMSMFEKRKIWINKSKQKPTIFQTFVRLSFKLNLLYVNSIDINFFEQKNSFP